MNIIQFNQVVNNNGHLLTYGLGDDNKMYVYTIKQGESLDQSRWIDINELASEAQNEQNSQPDTKTEEGS